MENLKILLSENEIREEVNQLAREIIVDYRFLVEKNESLVIVCVLKGAIHFYIDLTREIHQQEPRLRLEHAFVSASSYDKKTKAGKLKINYLELLGKVKDRNVLIVEDITDTNHTIIRIKRAIKKAKAASVRVCALLDKPSRHETDFRADYIGFAIPNVFVVGYGLDYAQDYRDLPFIAIFDQNNGT